MRELKCPKCGNVFSVDEADYASIVNQVKGAEFDAEVSRRIAELHKQHQAEEQACRFERAGTSERAFQERPGTQREGRGNRPVERADFCYG